MMEKKSESNTSLGNPGFMKLKRAKSKRNIFQTEKVKELQEANKKLELENQKLKEDLRIMDEK